MTPGRGADPPPIRRVKSANVPGHTETGGPWWSSGVFYQIYPRSFADTDGDGVGDLPGVTAHLDYLADLGVDALWLSPCFRSPQVDHGYDVSDYRAIDPLFGSLSDFRDLIAGAHSRSIRVTLDFVPNHTSDQHAWFRQAVAAGRGSRERARYLFTDGRGEQGELPPNNWRSYFGGPAWTRVVEADQCPGQWYLHLFAPQQPDLNWRNAEVLDEFSDVLRFWLDLGVDGFRIDVADALIKDDTWPDTADGQPAIRKDAGSPVHDVYRAVRAVFDEYPGQRMAVVETGAPDDVVALFIRSDEMHLAFAFRFGQAGFSGPALRSAIAESLAANAVVGAPTTWVTDNHDITRSVSRLAPAIPAPGSPAAVGRDLALGTRRARALTLLQLALPGAVCLYSGQELGLPNVDDLPAAALQDPIWERSGHRERGRDGCRIPMPWTSARPSLGFSASPSTWLPIPPEWAELSVEQQLEQPESMLMLYRLGLHLRAHSPALGRGELDWSAPAPDSPELLSFDLRGGGQTVRVVLNLGPTACDLPAGQLLLASVPLERGQLPGTAAAWIQLPNGPG